MLKRFGHWVDQVNCPNPGCPWHDPGNIPRGMRWYRKHGFYKSAQLGKVRRFICLKCHRTFSERRFREDLFYLHYDSIDTSDIQLEWLEGNPVREIAKRHGISTGMVRTRLRRLSYEPW